LGLATAKPYRVVIFYFKIKENPVLLLLLLLLLLVFSMDFCWLQWFLKGIVFRIRIVLLECIFSALFFPFLQKTRTGLLLHLTNGYTK
jgi:hypothetical protein